MLSTPHGTLGTMELESGEEELALLSTPHGTLGTVSKAGNFYWRVSFQLHTVH